MPVLFCNGWVLVLGQFWAGRWASPITERILLLSPSEYNVWGYLLTLELPPVPGRGRRQQEADQVCVCSLCLLPSEWWCAANDLPRPALLPRGHARDPQAAAVPWERGPGAPDRNGSHARQVRELLPLLLAATLPDCAYIYFKNYLLSTQATKNYFFKKTFFLFWKFYFFFFFFKQKFKVFYCGKPCNSEQIKPCCTIVLVGAIDCGGWARCLHVDAQRPQWE